MKLKIKSSRHNPKSHVHFFLPSPSFLSSFLVDLQLYADRNGLNSEIRMLLQPVFLATTEACLPGGGRREARYRV